MTEAYVDNVYPILGELDSAAAGGFLVDGSKSSRKKVGKKRERSRFNLIKVCIFIFYNIKKGVKKRSDSTP